MRRANANREIHAAKIQTAEKCECNIHYTAISFCTTTKRDGTTYTHSFRHFAYPIAIATTETITYHNDDVEFTWLHICQVSYRHVFFSVSVAYKYLNTYIQFVVICYCCCLSTIAAIFCLTLFFFTKRLPFPQNNNNE